MNKLDKFEELIKNSLEGYEMPYDASQWARLEQKLGGGTAPKGSKGIWYIAAGAAAITAISATIFFTNTPGNKQVDFLNKQIDLTDKNTPAVKSDTKTTQVINPANNNLTNTANIQTKPNEYNTANNANNKVNNNINLKLTTSELSPETVTNITENNNTSIVSTVSGNNINNLTNSNNTLSNSESKNDIKPILTIDKTTLCAGEKLTLKLDNRSAKIDLGNGEIISLNINEKKQISYAEAGIYNMHVADMPEITQTITVLAKPDANITYNTTIEEGRQITKISTDSYFNNGITWIFDDGKITHEKSTWKYYNKRGTYPIKLILEGNNGCKNEINKQIIIEEDYNLLAPNIFSPNGDGINETFIPEALKILQVNFIMTIYDRSGKLVYSTNTVDKPWDGRYTSDNKPAPAGVYIWVVKMTDDKGNVETFKGDIRLD